MSGNGKKYLFNSLNNNNNNRNNKYIEKIETHLFHGKELQNLRAVKKLNALYVYIFFTKNSMFLTVSTL